MILALDVGNTNITIGLFQRSKLIATWRIATNVERTEDELWLHVQHFHDQLGKTPEGIQGVVISSVVPHLTNALKRMVEKYLRTRPLIISGKLDLGIKVLTDDPSAVGADRLCGSVAAFTKYGGPVIVIDFGTATTFDAVTKKGEYLGGVIAPGLETSARALSRRAAMLPEIDLQFPDSIIGKNTRVSMQAGVMFGSIEATEGIIRRIRRAIGKHATVVATGGHAQLIAEMTGEIKYVEPILVLEGARLIYERVGKGKG